MQLAEHNRCTVCVESLCAQHCDNLVCKSARLGKLTIVTVPCAERLARYRWLGSSSAHYGPNTQVAQFIVHNESQRRDAVLTLQIYSDPTETERVFDAEAGMMRHVPTHRRAHNHLLIACGLSARPGFLRLYDYWVCEDAWPGEPSVRDELEKTHNIQTPSLYYMEWQRADGTYHQLLRDRVPVSRADRLWFYFELTYALNEALEELGLHHAAISDKCIFYVADAAPRTYRLPNAQGTSVTCSARLRPLLVAHRRSVLDTPSGQESDLRRLHLTMQKWYPHVEGHGGDIELPWNARFSYERTLTALYNKICQLT